MDSMRQDIPAETRKPTEAAEKAKTDRPFTNLKVRSGAKRGGHSLTSR